MLQKVRNTWIKGVLEQSLYNVARLELGLTTQPDAVEDVWEVLVQRPDQPQQHLPPGTRMSTAFDALGNALLILGAPGAGKTTLLLELTQDLLDRAERDANHALPVVFNLSSWAVRQPALNDWLVDELSERYQVPRKHAQSWVAKDLILPLLDGLDEVAAECRGACVEAINAFRTEHGLVPLAVCSRVADYESLTTKLRLPGALVVQPLTREQTHRYLAQAGAPLAGIRAALCDDEMLWELLDTPLMLSVAVLAYQGRTAAEVQTTGTLEERKTQLFAAYTDAMFQRRGKALPYSRQQTIQWLAWLASAMTRHNQSVFYLEWMQPNWLSSKWQQRLVNLGVIVLSGLIGALLFELVIGLAIGLERWHKDSWWSDEDYFGFFYLALFGLGGGLLMGLGILLWARDFEIRPVEKVQWVWSKAKYLWISKLWVGGLISGLFVVLMIVLVLAAFTLKGPSTNAPLTPFLLGAAALKILIIGLIFGVFGGLGNVLSGALVPSDLENRKIPNEGIQRSLRNAVFLGLGVVLIGALIVAPLVALYSTFEYSWLGLPITKHENMWMVLMSIGASVLIAGPFVALFIGLKNGGAACLQHLTLRFLLWRNGFAPWRYVRFLDYAAERIFLRKVGGGYIFIHRMLLEHFAALHPSDRKN